MKLMVVSPCEAAGGGEIHTVSLLERMPQHERYLVIDQNGLPQHIRQRADACAEHVQRLTNHPDPIGWLARELDRWQPDALVFWGTTLALGAIQAGGKLPENLIGIIHGVMYDWHKPFVEHPAAGSVNHWVCVAHKVEAMMRRCAPAQQAVRSMTIPNGIDLARFQPAHASTRDGWKAKFGYTADDFTLTYLGRLSGEKRVHRLVEALPHLPRKVKLLLAGWGPDQVSLAALADSLGVRDRVQFVGRVEDPRPIYYAADLLALPSSGEGSPLSIYEAIACGCPVAVTNVSDLWEELPPNSIYPITEDEMSIPGIVTRAMLGPLPEDPAPLVREKHDINRMVEAYNRLLDTRSIRVYTEAVAPTAPGAVGAQQSSSRPTAPNTSPTESAEAPVDVAKFLAFIPHLLNELSPAKGLVRGVEHALELAADAMGDFEAGRPATVAVITVNGQKARVTVQKEK